LEFINEDVNDTEAEDIDKEGNSIINEIRKAPEY
jgi:hypothetical protein